MRKELACPTDVLVGIVGEDHGLSESEGKTGLEEHVPVGLTHFRKMKGARANLLTDVTYQVIAAQPFMRSVGGDSGSLQRLPRPCCPVFSNVHERIREGYALVLNLNWERALCTHDRTEG